VAFHGNGVVILTQRNSSRDSLLSAIVSYPFFLGCVGPPHRTSRSLIALHIISFGVPFTFFTRAFDLMEDSVGRVCFSFSYLRALFLSFCALLGLSLDRCMLSFSFM
jgi:hypothetical protein